MDLGLAQKAALVTGGSKGIGLACAKALRAEGVRVAICSRNQQNIDKALAELPGAVGFTADLVDAAEAAALVARAEEAIGPLDILVNSAGAARRTPPDELSPAAWHAAMDAKYFSYIHVIDPVIKLMAARGRGVIVNIIGNGGKIASAVHIAGGAANAALMLATAGLGHAYAARGVRVVGLNPGLTETDRVAEGFASVARLEQISLEQARAEAVSRIPMGRMASPEDLANATLFLASEKAGYITGVTVSMDGAQSPIVL
ncbi:MAG TPA: SDR family oxidoreductase [Acidocella sp.]|jgi:NAD(P)-dependent dehydrogenase (short-subunit alcohol dehydrogenase family)|uniref:SDR family NAD(P)-dependent oxidoreductase n=1 Tax=Acidocella sp. TaxID=50710 RepID=UPI002D0FAEC2|nr:SDR family oxidoreductase [Acidocella sp.]HVE21590.1 SDR family oxidoreductase [Acidocella sp.]